MSKVFKNSSVIINLDENMPVDEKPMQCELLKTGIFSYFEPNDMILSKEVFDSMINNFSSNCRGIDLAVGYSHYDFNEAAGWIKGLSLSDDMSKLMAAIQWTPEAQKKIFEKEFRYLSAEFSYEYENEQGAKCGPTLFGAVLTNKPFMKNMKPLVALSEGKKEKRMELEKKLEELSVSVKTLSDEVAILKKSNEEKDEQIKKLNEVNEQEKAAKELEEKKLAFEKMLSEGKSVEAQREAFMSGDTKKFSELSAEVKLDTIGVGEGKTEKADYANLNCDQAEDEILKLAVDLTKKEKISLTEAHKKVMREQVVLADKYRAKFI